MKIFNFELWNDRGSLKATFCFEHEGYEFREWRVIAPEFGKIQVVGPRIKVTTKDGSTFLNTVRLPKPLMEEVIKRALEKYREVKGGTLRETPNFSLEGGCK